MHLFLSITVFKVLLNKWFKQKEINERKEIEFLFPFVNSE
jgi:hypothetical protein